MGEWTGGSPRTYYCTDEFQEQCIDRAARNMLGEGEQLPSVTRQAVRKFRNAGIDQDQDAARDACLELKACCDCTRYKKTKGVQQEAFKVGDSAEAVYSGEWYPVKIIGVNGGGSYHLYWTDRYTKSYNFHGTLRESK